MRVDYLKRTLSLKLFNDVIVHFYNFKFVENSIKSA